MILLLKLDSLALHKLQSSDGSRNDSRSNDSYIFSITYAKYIKEIIVRGLVVL